MKVIKYFRDLTDNGYEYHAGDTFPRDGLTVSQKRIEELAGNGNKRGMPLIEAVKPAKLSDAAKPEEKPKRRKKNAD